MRVGSISSNNNFIANIIANGIAQVVRHHVPGSHIPHMHHIQNHDHFTT